MSDKKKEPEKTFSYGGGVQSTAALVLAAQGKIDYRIFLFSNVGEDSEDPRTIDYVRNIAIPYAKENGLELIELERVKRDGTKETLYQRLTKKGSRSIPIPVRMSHNGAPGTRSCTIDFKIRVIGKWHRKHGASKKNPVTVGLGISMDEIHRMRDESYVAYQKLEYPLIDLRLNRDDCRRIIDEAGLPVPPKSACYFCPFHSLNAWVKLKRELPEQYEKACELEDILNRRRRKLGRDEVYFTRHAIPLRELIDEASKQGELFEGEYDGVDACESGYCWT